MIILFLAALVLLLIVGITYFGLTYFISEGFQDLIGEEKSFVNKQQTVYTNYPKDILTNPGVNDMAPALVVPDIFLDMGAVDTGEMAQRLVADPTNGYTDYDNKFCRSALMPLNMPKHVRGARDGCGWWYVADPSLTSTGVLGTQAGPIFTDGLPVGGVWMWNLTKAQELEEIKMCRQITKCELIDVNAVHLRCGFCPTSGYAVPVNTDGSEKYPENPNASCGEPVVMNGSDCEESSVGRVAVVASDGTSCQKYGRPSSDRKLRLYNDEECQNLNGLIQYDGQCMSQIGGNYSEDCASLNRVAYSVCSPDAGGRLSGNCLISIMRGLGYTSRSALIRIVSNGGNMEFNDTVAMKQLADVGVEIPATIRSGSGVGQGGVGGKIDRNTAANLYMRIKEQIRIGVSDRVREAAKWFVVGAVDYDPCQFDSNSKGPFPLSCVQQAWRIAGCQAAGSEYPREESDLTRYNGMTWGQINDLFGRKYTDINGSGNGSAQDDAISKCLGISIERAPGISCVARKQ